MRGHRYEVKSYTSKRVDKDTKEEQHKRKLECEDYLKAKKEKRIKDEPTQEQIKAREDQEAKQTLPKGASKRLTTFVFLHESYTRLPPMEIIILVWGIRKNTCLTTTFAHRCVCVCVCVRVCVIRYIYFFAIYIYRSRSSSRQPWNLQATATRPVTRPLKTT